MAHIFDNSDFAERIGSRDDLRTQAIAAVARLTDIITNAGAYTTAELRAALQDMAQYERALIRIVAR